MLALDTNILLRYLRNDDARQGAAARHLIDDQTTDADRLLVGGEVLAEFYWFFANKQKLSRQAIVELLWATLDNAHLAFSDETAITAAVDAYAQGPAGFVDYLIAAMARARGAEFTFTFDKDAAKHESFRLLSVGD